MKDLKRVGLVFKADGSVDFVKSLQSINSELKTNYEQMKIVQSSWDKNTKSSEKLLARQENLTNAYDLQKNKLRVLNEELVALKENENATENQIKRKEAQIKTTEATMANYQRRLEGVKKALPTADIKQFGKQLQDLGGKFQDAGKAIAPFSAAAAGIGTAAFAAAQQLDKSFKEIIKSTGATGKEAENLKKSFKDVYGRTPASSDEVAQAMGNLNTIMDITGKDLEDLTEKTLTYARVNNEEAGDSANQLGRLINGLGKEVKDVPGIMDKMTKASQMSGIGVGELTELLIDAGPAFDEMGFDLDRSIALFSSFTKAGANPKELVGSLNIAMTRMAKAGVTDANEAFHTLLKEIEDAPSIVKATEYAVELFGAKTGGKIADDIQAGHFQVDEWVEALQNAEGTLETVGEETLTFGDKMIVLKNEVTLALEPLGELVEDILTGLSDKLKQLISWFTELSPEMQRFLGVVTLIIAALAPVVIVVGKIIESTGIIIELLAPFIAWLTGTALPAVAAFFGVSVGWVLAVGAAIVALGVIIYKNWDAIKEWTIELYENIKEIFSNVIEWIQEVFENIKDFIVEKWEFVKETTLQVFTDIKEFIVEVFENVREWIVNAIDVIVETFVNMYEWVKEKAIDPLMKAFNAFLDFFKNLGLLMIAVVAMGIEKVWNYIKPFIEKVRNIFKNLKDTLSSGINSFKTFITNTFEKIRTFIVSIINKIKETFKVAFSFLRENVVQPFANFITNSFNAIRDRIVAIVERIKNVWTNTINFIRNNLIAPLIAFFANVFNGVWNTINSVISKIRNGFSSAIAGVKTMFTGLRDTIKNIFSSVAGIIKAPINGVISAINGVLGTMNKIKVPKWVPGFGGKGINFSMLKMLYKGGNLLGGAALVGEAGPELLEVGGGRATVTPLTDGGGAIPRDFIDYDKFANILINAMLAVFAEMKIEMNERTLGKFIKETVRGMI